MTVENKILQRIFIDLFCYVIYFLGFGNIFAEILDGEQESAVAVIRMDQDNIRFRGQALFNKLPLFFGERFPG